MNMFCHCYFCCCCCYYCCCCSYCCCCCYYYCCCYCYNSDCVDITDEEGDGPVKELQREFIAFEKRHGTKQSIESAIVTQRRAQYRQLVTADIYNYDAWMDLIRLEEAEHSDDEPDKVRDVYSQAVACVPPVAQKRYWKRYIYLWINYALFEELQQRDVGKARVVYKACLDTIPHKHFTFGKIWMLAAQLEIRCKDVTAARKILGRGIGTCDEMRTHPAQLHRCDTCTAITVQIQHSSSSSSSNSPHSTA